MEWLEILDIASCPHIFASCLFSPLSHEFAFHTAFHHSVESSPEDSGMENQMTFVLLWGEGCVWGGVV